MKVFKYILFIAIALVLWITAPLWIPESHYNSTTTSEVDTFVSTQEAERNKLLKVQDKERAVLEAKFGKKSSVMKTLKKYLHEIYQNDNAFELLQCSRINSSPDGWRVVCPYRKTSSTGNVQLSQDTFTIKHGVVSQSK